MVTVAKKSVKKVAAKKQAQKPKVVPVQEVESDSDDSIVDVTSKVASAGLGKGEEDKKDALNGECVIQPEDLDQRLMAIKGQSRVAINALKKYFASKGGKSLFPELDEALHLSFLYKKQAADGTGKGLKRRILLPKPWKTLENSTICLIMGTLDRSEKARCDPDVEKDAREWAIKLEEEHGLKQGLHYTTVLTMRQLERQYSTYKEQRALCSAYDVFMVEGHVAKPAKRLLGRKFYENHKLPLEFGYNFPMATSIENALKTSIFSTHPFMVNVTVQVGHLGQSSSDLGENIDTIIDEAVNHIPGGFGNVRAIYVKPTSGQPNLPIYSDESTANTVSIPKRDGVALEQRKVIDELTTLPEGLKVAVYPDGRVRVLREADDAEVLYPTVRDEWEDTDDMKPTVKPPKNSKGFVLQSEKEHNEFGENADEFGSFSEGKKKEQTKVVENGAQKVNGLQAPESPKKRKVVEDTVTGTVDKKAKITKKAEEVPKKKKAKKTAA